MSKDTQKSAPVKKQRLGRGLDSLLGGGFDEEESPPPKSPEVMAKEALNIEKEKREEAAPEAANHSAAAPSLSQPMVVPDHQRIWEVAIEDVIPNKNQPRKTFPGDALQSLADSLKEKGLLQPITVRKITVNERKKFEIIAGERRWRAAQKAGLQKVPVILKDTDDQNALELALIENIQRQDLNPIDEALAYKYLIDEYQLTQQELAKRVGKERATIANLLRLLGLAPAVRDAVKNGYISLGQAKVLASVTDHKIQQEVSRKVVKSGLTVRATEKLIAKLGKSTEALKETDQERLSKVQVGKLIEELQKVIGTKVAIQYSGGKGKVAIHFYSIDELNEIVDQIRDKWHS